MISLAALLVVPTLHATTPDRADSLLNGSGRPYDLGLVAEIGTLLPIANEIRLSKSGTTFDYLDDGGQDNLFLFTRLSAEMDWRRSTFILLYQPLDLRTQGVPDEDVLIDDAMFFARQPLDVRYGFDFYRASWLWDAQEDPDRELGLGLSLQIRNASLAFTSSDGETRRINNDIGPVPILKVRSRQPLGSGGAWWGFEADGFYAPIKYVNGSGTDVVGAILDTSLRAGVPLENGGEAFLNLRYLGGGAEGTSKDLDGPGDGWVSNWLHFASLSMGLALR